MQLNIGNQSFTGLIGKSTTNSMIYKNTLLIKETVNYHPFNNESKDEISNFVKNNTKYFEFDKRPLFCATTSVAVKKSLPFSKEDYFNYKKSFEEGKPLSKIGKFVDKTLKKNSLYNYMNVNPETVKNKSIFSRLLKIFKK